MIKKIEISKSEEESHTQWCERCDESFCDSCIDFHIIEFDIEENIHEGKSWLNPDIRNWKEIPVCPWCYNQLVDKKNKEKK